MSEDRDKALLDALAPPVRQTGWVVVVTDADGVFAVFGPYDDVIAARACRDVIRCSWGQEVEVVQMREPTAHDIHERVRQSEVLEPKLRSHRT